MSEYSFFEALKTGLEEAIAYKQGDHSKCRVSVRSIPEITFKAADVARFREEANLSQQMLAYVIGVSPQTVKAWERGKNEPSKAAQRLLYLLETDHSLVERLIAR